jgi:hypothetical protein
LAYRTGYSFSLKPHCTVCVMSSSHLYKCKNYSSITLQSMCEMYSSCIKCILSCLHHDFYHIIYNVECIPN